jgi:hypothetical protein
MRVTVYLMPIFIIVSLFTSSCSKYLGVDPPKDKQSSVTIFADSLSASGVVVGVYIKMMSGNTTFVSSIVRYASLSSDELGYLGSDDNTQFVQNEILRNNENVNGLWSNLYEYIGQCNNAIEGINASPSLSADAKRFLTGEAKFIRSFCFFYLVNLWGSVPLTIVSDYRITEKMPRTLVDQVYEQIIEDLKDAQNDLPADYPTAERVRPNKQVVSSFLARIYLYTQQWKMAEEESSKVIQSGQYILNQNLKTTFLKTSKETIWQLPATDNFTFASFDASFFVPASLSPTSLIPPNFPVSSKLYGAFENTDKRKTAWIGTKKIGTKVYNYPFKYTVRKGVSQAATTEYTIMLRLSEQYLIRAEARVKQGNIDGAMADVDSIRSKAGLPLISVINPAISADSLMELIMHERYLEFFCEWGNRWLDLKRTHTADLTLKTLKSPNWQADDTLYPIPVRQIFLNPFLRQNPGY